jgi:RNA polymerase sigma-70 factor (ECF subfamily)
MSSSGTTLSGPTPSEQRWRLYLERIGTGDSACLQALYDETSRLLYGLAYRILGNPSDAEEVILDVYHQVWSSAKRYDSARGSVWSWLMVMTRNRAIDRMRKTNLRKTLELPIEEPAERVSDAPPPETQIIFAQERMLVRQAMATLGEEQRKAIELAFFSGLTHIEVAETLGAPLGTIKTRIRAGMQKLREALPAGVWAVRS